MAWIPLLVMLAWLVWLLVQWAEERRDDQHREVLAESAGRLTDEQEAAARAVIHTPVRDWFPQWFAEFDEEHWPEELDELDEDSLLTCQQSVEEERVFCRRYPDSKFSRRSLAEAEAGLKEQAAGVVERHLRQARRSALRRVEQEVREKLGELTEEDRKLSDGLMSFYFFVSQEEPIPDERKISEEVGELTEEDYKFLSEHKDHLFPPIRSEFEVDILTEEGRSLAADLLREDRRKQLALLDHYRKKGSRNRLAAKRALLAGGKLSQTNAEEQESNTKRGERFEAHTANVLSAEWPDFECRHLGKDKRSERGIDLLFVGPNGERIGVQCKQHAEEREPSYQEWQSFLGGCTFHRIPEGSRVFVTTGTLTVRQWQEAQKLGVLVFYKDELAAMAQEHGIEPWS